VLAALGIGRAQLAAILGGQGWERLDDLVALLDAAGIHPRSPLNVRVVRSQDQEGRSLLELLRAPRWDRPRLVAALRRARAESLALDRRRQDREARLVTLGYEPVGQDERRRRLAQNLALWDWPR